MVDAVPAPAGALSRLRRVLGAPLAEWLAVLLICAGLAAGASAWGWLWRVDSLLYDAAMATQRHDPDVAVRIVAIDDRSLAEIGRWPWPRAVHAQLVERLREAGAAVVVLDIILAEEDPHDPAGDAALARAMAAHGAVVLPVTHGTYGARSAGEALPAAPFAAVAAAFGHIHIELDPDGIARSVYLWEGMRAPHHPQLALAALELLEPATAARFARPQVEPADGWRRDAWLHVPFIGPPGSHPYLSYVDVLRGALAAGELRGRVVFVGASAVGMGDIVPTPTSGHARPMPGVEVHATVFGALRNGSGIHSIERSTVAWLALAVVAALMALMLRAGPRFTLVAAFACALAVLAGSWLLLRGAQLWLPPAGMLAGCVLAYPLWSWRRLEAAQRYLDNELRALQRTGESFGLALASAPAGSVIDPFRARIDMVRAAARRERDLQRFVADTLDALPVGAMVADAGGRIRLANRQAADLLGCSAPQAQHDALAAMPWPPALARAAGLPAPAAGTSVAVEASTDSGRALLVSAAGLAGVAGEGGGVVIGIADITALRAAQRAREDTMHFLSHDLRAPLTAILTLVEGEGGVPCGDGKNAQRLLRHARGALHMADQLLRLSRAEALDPARFRELAVDMVVMDAADEVWALARGKDVLVDTRIEVGEAQLPALILGDGELLCRALVNLLTNAIKYSPPGGTVALVLSAAAGGWAVAVSDSGPGIAPEHLPRLFRRFGRVPSAERRDGIGLGLLMVRTVAERHGGSVDVRSAEGQGSTFTLFLPAQRS